MTVRNPAIQHLVISGGGISLFKLIGSLDVLLRDEPPYFSMQQIKSIYGTSAGAIIGTVLALGYEWDVVVDYFIKRPWKDVIQINVQSILDAYSRRGLFDQRILEIIFKPLLDAKDIPLQINLAAFFDVTGIDLHFFTLELNRYVIEDVSHKTHPDLSLLTALQMTACLPVLFSPVILGEKCYVDAGCIVNYPLQRCLDAGHDADAILGFKNQYDDIYEDVKNHTTQDSTLLEYLMNLFFKIVWEVSTECKQPKIKNEVLLLKMQPNTFSSIQKAIQLESERALLFQAGQESARLFLSSSSGL